MKKHNVFSIEGMEFPAGRRTRVMIGENGAIDGEYFCQGYVVIYPGGSIPRHDHITVESYLILKGEGEMTIDDEIDKLVAGDFVYMDKNQHHSLKNIGSEDLHLIFVYAPKMIVDHWAQEKKGML